MSSMDIYARAGTKVRFTPGGSGYETQNKAAREVLELNAIYTVSHTEVGGWMSYVTLQEFPKQSFNTVLFENVDESSL